MSTITATDRTAPTRPTRASFTTAIGLVIEREIMVRVKSKAFMISTLLSIVLFGAAVAASGALPSLFASTDKVAVTSAETVAGIEGIEPVEVAGVEEAKELVRTEAVAAAVVDSPDSPTGTTVIALRSAPESLAGALSLTPDVEILDPDAPDPTLTKFIGLGLGLIFLSSAMTFGVTIASSVVEEKQSRIVEILLASASAKVLMFGKVIACSILAFAQIALTAVAVLVGAAISGNDLVLGRLAAPIAWFIPLFVVGFVMIAALYAAAASMVSRSEDLGSTSSPLMMLILLPYMAVVLFADNEAVMAVLSYIPFSAAVAVPMRVFMGTTEWWEPVVSLAILGLTTVLALLLATRIFEGSILRSGPRVTWRQALSPA
ncbi:MULTISPECIES: ABC transporter permease [Brevibacterium]|uniref:ABC transporter permease n=1 Tax=Brevibacterium casei TaxID=33889 RepID=A0A269ZGJ1_9MICO|nr:ABC transporter permease [Brevibacterium casei]SIH77858.1 ABC-2 family transporter protein [Mycobacteroides abscessus subsp. abscessus]MCT1549724.1 ABC transporter permease [Brevibacterium casei]MCT1561987.1 ABC transporter permease [Brevibacterium casei]MCT2207765.1 ABC transporter permease [Brevibacterium casei]PAK96711.1 ABC transporter permease [Brevibacterium casei]